MLTKALFKRFLFVCAVLGRFRRAVRLGNRCLTLVYKPRKTRKELIFDGRHLQGLKNEYYRRCVNHSYEGHAQRTIPASSMERSQMQADGAAPWLFSRAEQADVGSDREGWCASKKPSDLSEEVTQQSGCTKDAQTSSNCANRAFVRFSRASRSSRFTRAVSRANSRTCRPSDSNTTSLMISYN